MMENTFTSLLPILLLAAMPGLTAADDAPAAGQWARYRMLSSFEKKAPPIPAVTLTCLGSPRPGLRRWRLEMEKWVQRPGAADATGRTVSVATAWSAQIAAAPKDIVRFAVEVEADWLPMSQARPANPRIIRYILHDVDGVATDFRDARSGGPLLPGFNFVQDLLPQARLTSARSGGFHVTGSLLGHALVLDRQGAGPVPAGLSASTLITMRLNPDYTSGICHTVQDTRQGRLPHAVADSTGYSLMPMTEADYRESIAAGMNLFLVGPAQEAWIRHLPTFYHQYWTQDYPFPEVFYRSNYLGMTMFVDEPACRMNLHAEPGLDIRSGQILAWPEAGAELVRHRARARYNSEESWGRNRLVRLLRENGYNLGTWPLVDGDYPIWEAAYTSSFYQMQEARTGLVHQGRIGHGPDNREITRYCGQHLGRLLNEPDLPMTASQMMDFVIAWLRGPARVFNLDWGYSIYGQADPALAPGALIQAYDAGARYLWFWTIDKAHHVPFDEQLALARRLKEHAAAHPRPPRASLNRAARVAIALPEGYMYEDDEMWLTPHYLLSGRNAGGFTYRDVLTAVIWPAYCLGRAGIPYDFVIQDPAIEKAGYDTILRIDDQGRIRLHGRPIMWPSAAAKPVAWPPAMPSARVEQGEAPEARARHVEAGAIRLDGDLADWSQADWRALEQHGSRDALPLDGPGDLAARFALAWDGRSLYVAVDVTDDTMRQDRPLDAIWMADSIQIALDPLEDRKPDGYAPDDYEIGVAWRDGQPAIWAWQAGQQRDLKSWLSTLEAAVKPRPGGMIYEVRLPLDSLAPLAAHPHFACGLNVVVNDADSRDNENYLEWTDATVSRKSPAAMGRLRFGAPVSGSLADVFAWRPATRVGFCGQDLRLPLDAAVAAARALPLTVRIQSNILGAKPIIRPLRIKLPAGDSQASVAMPTAGLAPGQYQVTVEPAAGATGLSPLSFQFFQAPG